jgi:hypothetical protein
MRDVHAAFLRHKSGDSDQLTVFAHARIEPVEQRNQHLGVGFVGMALTADRAPLRGRGVQGRWRS